MDLARVMSSHFGVAQKDKSPVVGFIDMDCFYVAVEKRLDPTLDGLPCAVVQYNSSAGAAPDLPSTANRRVNGQAGGIIAVSYEARSRGVTRSMNCQDARRKCPEVVFVQVPTAFGKADLRIYKDAGDSVVRVLASRVGLCEKRSVDEVAIDITDLVDRYLQERNWEELMSTARASSHLADSLHSRNAAAVSRDDARRGHVGQNESTCAANTSWDCSTWNTTQRRLVVGGVVLNELRAAVRSELGFSCSGAVAQTKLLAKLGCGLHKPNQQTIVLPEAVSALFQDLPLDRLPGLGGELGAQVKEALGVVTASELASVPLDVLEGAFPKRAAFLRALTDGSYNEPVQDRELNKSLSSGKTFTGRNKLNTADTCEYWLRELASELHLRYTEDFAKHRRAPTKVSVYIGGGHGNASRQATCDLGSSGSLDQIVQVAWACFRRWLPGGTQSSTLGVTNLGMSLSGFRSCSKEGAPIKQFFSEAGPQRQVQCQLAGTEASADAVCDARTTYADRVTCAASGPLARSFAASKVWDCEKEENPADLLDPTVIELDDEDEPKLVEDADMLRSAGLDPAVVAQLPSDVQSEIFSNLQSQTLRKREGALHHTRSQGAKRQLENSGVTGIRHFFRSSPGKRAAV